MTLSRSRTTTGALVAAGLLAVAGCGGADKPAESPASSEAGGVERTGGAPAGASVRGNGVDRAFVAAMIPHHRSAVAMAKIARQQGTSTFVKRLARDLVASQSREISAMRREDRALQRAGVKRGSLRLPAHMKGMDTDARMLKRASPFDQAFLGMMTVHHHGALGIARVEIARGRDPELRRLAARIVKVQTREIRAMREQLGELAARTPAAPTQRDPRARSPDMPVADPRGLPAPAE